MEQRMEREKMKKIGEQKKGLSAKSLIEKTGGRSSSRCAPNMGNGPTDVESPGRKRHDRRGTKRSAGQERRGKTRR